MSEDRDRLIRKQRTLDARLRDLRPTSTERVSLVRERQRLDAQLRRLELTRDRPVRPVRPEPPADKRPPKDDPAPKEPPPKEGEPTPKEPPPKEGEPHRAAAVLLPLRLETRFDGTRLKVRIVPDEVWVAAHDERPTRAELGALVRYLRSREDADDKAAWTSFARTVGGGRAAWLERAFAPDGDPGTVDMDEARADDDPAFPRVIGFPEELELWATWTDGSREPLATLPVDLDALTLDLPIAADDQPSPRWWESFAAATAVGLGVEVELGERVEDLDVLSVVGLAEDDPGSLFDAHRDAGNLGTIAPGTPTARVDGRPAADRDPDAATRWEARRAPLAAGQAELSEFLTGDAGRLLLDGGLPGGVGVGQQALVAATWPAVAGFGLHEVLGVGTTDGLLGDWASHSLRPLGPLPTLRVGRQPYGVLPIAATHRSRPTDAIGHLEHDLITALRPIRTRMAAAVTDRGTVEEADAAGLLGHIGQAASSSELRSRVTVPEEAWALMLLLTSGDPMVGPHWSGVDEDEALGLEPNRRYASRHATELLPMPLIAPGEDDVARDAAWPAVAEGLKKLLHLVETSPSGLADSAAILRDAGLADDDGPTALVAVLAVRALQLAAADIVRETTQDTAPLLEPGLAGVTGDPRLAALLAELTPSMLTGPTAAAERFARVAEGWGSLTGATRAEVEVGVRAMLDATSYRLDPWLTAPAYRQLRDLLDTADPNDPPLMLGAYGFVERPRPRTAGPTDGGGGLLLAPSDTQVTTAAILRDRAVADAEPERWQLNITSDAIRDAGALAARVRDGHALSEAIGQELESRVGDRGAIHAMRHAASRSGSIALRRPCDGLLLVSTDPDDLPERLRDDPTVMGAIATLRRALETYADLLVAEGVYEVVEGRPDAAAAALDAAAGFAQPPTMDVIGTRTRGRSIGTTSLSLLPAAEGPTPDAMAAPGRIADPSVAAWLDGHLGAAGTWSFEVRPARDVDEARTVTLDDLKLDPIDVLAFPEAELERLVAGLAFPDATSPAVGGLAMRRLAQARRLVAALGRPATISDLDEDPGAEPSDAVALDASLRGRLEDLHVAARGLADRCRTAAAAPGVDPGTLAELRRATYRWGLRVDGDDPAVELASLADALDARRQAAPADGGAGLETDELVAAIKALASRSGTLAVLGELPPDALPKVHAAPELDEDWLATLAAVRPRLARLDAAQLATEADDALGLPLRAITNRPEDPWQQDVSDPRRLIVGHVPAKFDPHRDHDVRIAVGVVDRFVETVPAAEQTAAGAFGFHAPGARAPQAILVALAPFPGSPLNTYELNEVLVEVREASRARMARPAELDAFAHLAPMTTLPVNGPTGFAGLQTVLTPPGDAT